MFECLLLASSLALADPPPQWITCAGSATGRVMWASAAVTNADAVTKAVWKTSGLGCYELFVNGARVDDGVALKPGWTDWRKTKYEFTSDVTALFRRARGAANVLAAEVAPSWWSDRIMNLKNPGGRRSGFRGTLELSYAGGRTERFVTRPGRWSAAFGGPTVSAGIYEGEICDARIPVSSPTEMPAAVANGDYSGETLPSPGGEVVRRNDLALEPVAAWSWNGATGAGPDRHGTVAKMRTFARGELLTVRAGERLTVDFGQNAAAVPAFDFEAAEGVTLTALPGEMLNDADGLRSRGNDGPEGSVYRQNLRYPDTMMRFVYTFGKTGRATWSPHFTYCGYRYLEVAATGTVTLHVKSVPITSVRAEDETGTLETGDADVNRFISCVRWTGLSNVLSAPTDCPQRSERLGWGADAGVHSGTQMWLSDAYGFYAKWCRDLRDGQNAMGGFPAVAPAAWVCLSNMAGWDDACVTVAHRMYVQTGDRRIVDENWAAMERFVSFCVQRNALTGDIVYQDTDWLSFDALEASDYKVFRPGFRIENGVNEKTLLPEALDWWRFFAACHLVRNCDALAEMAAGTGRPAEAEKQTALAARLRSDIRERHFNADGTFRFATLEAMQAPKVYALSTDVYRTAAERRRAARALAASIRDNGGRFKTGIHATARILDVLCENGETETAYALLLHHGNPGWLYMVDCGATTVWERWNGWMKEKGFYNWGMNSFNHPVYCSPVGWLFRCAAGIRPDPKHPGFRRFVLAPHPDRRLGFLKATYRSRAGLIRSEWRYDGDVCTWTFAVPEGTTAEVRLPDGSAPRTCGAGTHSLTISSLACR